MSGCGELYLKWIRAEQGAHVSLLKKRQSIHRKYEKLSEKLFVKAAKKGCRWAR